MPDTDRIAEAMAILKRAVTDQHDGYPALKVIDAEIQRLREQVRLADIDQKMCAAITNDSAAKRALKVAIEAQGEQFKLREAAESQLSALSEQVAKYKLAAETVGKELDATVEELAAKDKQLASPYGRNFVPEADYRKLQDQLATSQNELAKAHRLIHELADIQIADKTRIKTLERMLKKASVALGNSQVALVTCDMPSVYRLARDTAREIECFLQPQPKPVNETCGCCGGPWEVCDPDCVRSQRMRYGCKNCAPVVESLERRLREREAELAAKEKEAEHYSVNWKNIGFLHETLTAELHGKIADLTAKVESLDKQLSNYKQSYAELAEESCAHEAKVESLEGQLATPGVIDARHIERIHALEEALRSVRNYYNGEIETAQNAYTDMKQRVEAVLNPTSGEGVTQLVGTIEPTMEESERKRVEKARHGECTNAYHLDYIKELEEALREAHDAESTYFNESGAQTNPALPKELRTRITALLNPPSGEPL